jgi:hypothetical protein
MIMLRGLYASDVVYLFFQSSNGNDARMIHLYASASTVLYYFDQVFV